MNSEELTTPLAMPNPDAKGVDVISLVIQDMESRRQYGIKKYGQSLTTNNGRKPLVDYYQETLDAAQYIRQEIEEEKERFEALKAKALSEILTEILIFAEGCARTAHDSDNEESWCHGYEAMAYRLSDWATYMLATGGIIKAL